MSDSSSNPPPTPTEEWFLSKIGEKTIPVGEIRSTLESMRTSGAASQAESWAEVLQDTLAERKQFDEALEILHLRAAWKGGVADPSWAQEALDVVGALWDQKAMVDECGFDRASPGEAMRRLRLLRSLQEGVMCYDRTWGLGVVLKPDPFYKRVEIEFERRSGHQLSYAYAGERLQVVGDNHLLVWKRKKAADLAALVADRPDEVVRMALHSFGPLTAAQLQTSLVPAILPEAEWKKFWDAARKALKKDATVVIPTARTEPLRLLEGGASRESDWFATLARELDLDRITEALETLAEAGKAIDPQRVPVLRDRLAYALHGAKRTHPEIEARLHMAAFTLGLGSESAADAFLSAGALQNTIRKLSARNSKRFLRFLATRDAAKLDAILLDQLPKADISFLNEILSYFLDDGRDDAVAVVFRAAFAARSPSLEMMSWLGRSLEKIEQWRLGPWLVAMQFMMDALESEATGLRLKAQNQLREKFSKPEWLKEWLARLDENEQKSMLLRIKESSAWPTLDRQSVLGQLVKLNENLAPLLASKADAEEGTRGPVTSQRSYEDRRRQLDHIVNVEIPKVAKDIAIARSYGDLRENFEYKAAKEAQTILFHRRDELMAQLRKVKPTDFREYPGDRAGMAATVELEYGDGRRERYHILGEWDGDPSRSILSSTSRMAQALQGHAVGDQFPVPTEDGETTARLVSVAPLSPELLAWAEGRDGVEL